MDALVQLYAATRRGDAAGVAAALAMGVNVNEVLMGGNGSALHEACRLGRPQCAGLLLAAGADHALRHGIGRMTALHIAASCISGGHAACVAALLAAGADPLATAALQPEQPGWTPLHCAAAHGNLAAARLLAEAAPTALAVAHGCRRTPVGLAVLGASLAHQHAHHPAQRLFMDTARYLMAAAPPAPREPAVILDRLATGDEWLLPLLPCLASHVALTSEQWAAVPSRCHGLGIALPAVLRRSEAEAAQLVRRLPPAGQQRLRTLAFCLGAAARRGRLPPLPTPIVQWLLAEAAAQHGQQEMQLEQDQWVRLECWQRRRARLLQPTLAALMLACIVPDTAFRAAVVVASVAVAAAIAFSA